MLIFIVFTCFIYTSKRMVLATGSVPTEKIPSRSHEVETKRRRVLVRNTSEPSTSAGLRSSTPTT